MIPRSPCASSPAAVKTKIVTITQIFILISETSLFSLDLSLLAFLHGFPRGVGKAITRKIQWTQDEKA
jgi:hypothetical protein